MSTCPPSLQYAPPSPTLDRKRFLVWLLGEQGAREVLVFEADTPFPRPRPNKKQRRRLRAP